jgi:hypothetical protein
MGLGKAIDCIRERGRVCVGPSNLSAAYPHGGTGLGLIRDIEFQPGIRNREIAAEEFGGIATEYIRLGERAALTGVLRAW